MKLSRRGWNNVLILGIMIFMVALNLPNVFKAAREDSEQIQEYPFLINPQQSPLELHFSDWSLTNDGSDWISSKELTVSTPDLIQRWTNLVGTEVDDPTFQQLKSQLSSANTIEVWYQGVEEPQRVTYYETPNFWLMQNWQSKWIAVSVESEYLFPFK
ncbi:hypothetical protein P7F88_12725 [Vibrio hannami]|uniref:hypothetical protein n=1 Tax=Vibrio hannami TaxID=2717094 RepID=UPI002410717E|nr:hypothetical protein [Vibrio hannami]MDG3086907.1 hypothetical protein [Vibrio hannami]